MAVLLILTVLALRGFSPWLAAVVGIAIGEGFALVEDVAYLMNRGLPHPYSTFEGAQQSFTARNAFPNVGHWLCIGVAGVGAAAMLGSRPLPSVFASVYATLKRRVRWETVVCRGGDCRPCPVELHAQRRADQPRLPDALYPCCFEECDPSSALPGSIVFPFGEAIRVAGIARNGGGG